MKEFFEDLEPGRTFQTDRETITEDEIIRFGLEWDSQPFHVDRVAAKASLFGELVASGLHTLVLTFRLCVQAEIFTGNAVAGLGFKEIRFPNPVYPGNILRAVATVRQGRRSKSKPDFGVVEWDLHCRDQDERLVMTMQITNLVRCRNANHNAAQRHDRQKN